MTIPRFESRLPAFNMFITRLNQELARGTVTDWDGVRARVRAFFTPERMARMEVLVPAWRAMAAEMDGKTLVHVVSVLAVLRQLPDYQNAAPDVQALLDWIVLYHDAGKRLPPGKRDLTHGFRSAVVAARGLPHAGFPVTSRYSAVYPGWARRTAYAKIVRPEDGELVQDNAQLPAILAGIDTLFGAGTPGALAVQGVLLHMSITNLAEWPQSAPLDDAQIARFTSPALHPLLCAVMIADSEAWHLFEPDIRQRYHAETRAVFARIAPLVGVPPQADATPSPGD